MKKIITLLVTFLILNYIPTYAWGDKGHKLVASIVKLALGESTAADSVQSYLGEMSFEDASVWMDKIRSDQAYDYMKPWHYVNIEKGKKYAPTEKPDIIKQLNYSIQVINSKSKHTRSEIRTAILVILHLGGDIHQPLHCGFADDKGGNAIDVKFLDKKSNLHKVWDTEIIEKAGITIESCLKSGNLSNRTDSLKFNVESWAEESRKLLPSVYDYNKKIDKAYTEKNKPVIEKQIFKAAYRIADLLIMLGLPS